MHDRFEKEVQKKMEELNLVPSAPVWEKIELEIKPERKKRKLILWLVLGILFLGGGYLTYQLAGNNEQTTGKRFETETTKESTSIQGSRSTQKPGTTADAVPADKEPGLTKNGNLQVPAPGRPGVGATPHRKPGEITTETGPLNNSIAGRKIHNKTNPQAIKEDLPGKRQAADFPGVTNKTQPAVTTPVPGDNKSAIVTESAVIEPAPVDKDSVAKPLLQTKELPFAPVDSAAKKKRVAKNGWKKQINFAVGRTGYGAGVLVNTPGGFASASPSAAGTSPINLSEGKGGLGVTAGFSMAKKLGRHFEISVGVQYASYSTKTSVGANRQVDTVIRTSSGSFNTAQYYTNTTANRYTNRFQAIEVPVTITYRPSLNLPLYLSAGAAYGRLVATNALTYSRASNVYYEDKEIFVTDMVPVFTSIQAELFPKKKVSVRIGPFVQYNLLKLRKENSADAPHLLFAGLKAAINF